MNHIRNQHRPAAGSRVQSVAVPSQGDVQKMIQDAEFEGMTMSSPIVSAEAS